MSRSPLQGDPSSLGRKGHLAHLGEPSYFAIGAGVAGAHGATTSGHLTDTDIFELAKNAPIKAMVNGKGVDHLDDAITIVAGTCLGGPPA